jgi:hypothetical protein
VGFLPWYYTLQVIPVRGASVQAHPTIFSLKPWGWAQPSEIL